MNDWGFILIAANSQAWTRLLTVPGLEWLNQQEYDPTRITMAGNVPEIKSDGVVVQREGIHYSSSVAILCCGDDVISPYVNMLGYSTTCQGGQSGGPIWLLHHDQNKLIGIHSGGAEDRPLCVGVYIGRIERYMGTKISERLIVAQKQIEQQTKDALWKMYR